MQGFWNLGWLLALWAVSLAQGQFAYTTVRRRAHVRGREVNLYLPLPGQSHMHIFFGNQPTDESVYS